MFQNHSNVYVSFLVFESGLSYIAAQANTKEYFQFCAFMDTAFRHLAGHPRHGVCPSPNLSLHSWFERSMSQTNVCIFQSKLSGPNRFRRALRNSLLEVMTVFWRTWCFWNFLAYLNSIFVIKKNSFDVCVSVHHIWKWREVATWCNNCGLLS